MKRLILLVALVMAMAVLAPAAFADEAEEVEGSDVEVEEKDHSAAQEWKAQMIADYFSAFLPEDAAEGTASAEEADETLDDTLLPQVTMLREVTGWGSVFKLMMYAAATGEDPSLIGPFAGEGGYGFGKLLKDLDFEGEFTNLGQLQKSYKDKPEKPAKVMPPQSNRNKDKHNG